VYPPLSFIWAKFWMIGDLWCLVKLRFTLIPFYLDPVLELPILLVGPRYIQSAILIATTLLYHLNMIFTVATKQFTIFHPPPLGGRKNFSARECGTPLRFIFVILTLPWSVYFLALYDEKSNFNKIVYFGAPMPITHLRLSSPNLVHESGPMVYYCMPNLP